MLWRILFPEHGWEKVVNNNPRMQLREGGGGTSAQIRKVVTLVSIRSVLPNLCKIIDILTLQKPSYEPMALRIES